MGQGCTCEGVSKSGRAPLPSLGPLPRWGRAVDSEGPVTGMRVLGTEPAAAGNELQRAPRAGGPVATAPRPCPLGDVQELCVVTTRRGHC